MDHAIQTASDVDSLALRDCVNDSFAGYLIFFPRFDAASWPVFLRRQGVDIRQSLVTGCGDRVTAFALITPRAPDRWRVAGMGARPEVRGSGSAARLLHAVASSAAAQGVRTLELEVFHQNERARRLYLSRGFEVATVLHGFTAGDHVVANSNRIEEVSRETAVAWANRCERAIAQPLPWQVCGDAIRCLPGTSHFWRLDDAQTVFTEVADEIVVNSLLDRDPDWRGAVKLLHTLKARFPGSTLRAPQLQAEYGAARAFRLAGWEQVELFQELMQR